jgi:tetratricopeptide (TPR) repeat protein
MVEESDDIFQKGMAYCCYGASCYCKALFDQAENNLLKGLAFCGKTDQIIWESLASWFLGHTYVDMGRYSIAQDYYDKSISSLECANLMPTLTNLLKISTARAKVLNNDQDIHVSEVFEQYNNMKYKVIKGWAARLIGDILLNIDGLHISDADDWIKKAIDADKRNGGMFSLGMDYALYAELSKRKRDKAKSREALKKAIEIYRECGADGWVEKAKKELAGLS